MNKHQLHSIIRISVLSLGLFFFGCIGDFYFDTRDSFDDSKVSRSYAVRQFYSAVVVKRSLCPGSIDSSLFSAGFNTTNLKAGCNGFSTTKESQKTLRSCNSETAYVEKKDLAICINEVLFFPCESIANARVVLRPNFPVCRGMFGPGPAAPLSM